MNAKPKLLSKGEKKMNEFELPMKTILVLSLIMFVASLAGVLIGVWLK